jgi:hypothetical protein
MYLSSTLLPAPVAVLATQKSRMKSGVTIWIRSKIAATNTMAEPSVVAFAMSNTSAQRGEKRFEPYRPKEEKTMCHARRKHAKRAKFWTFTRMERKSAKEIVAVWCATRRAASPKETVITAKSKSLAASIRMRRRRAVMIEDRRFTIVD